MNNIWKMAKLDYYLMKTYSKTIIFTMIYPAVMAIMNKSLVSGISFVMVFMGMMSGYVFLISEKNDMGRLYSILPVSKKHMVLGRYLYVGLFGLSVLLISLPMQLIILQVLGITVSSEDILGAVLTGIITFSFYPVFLFPGYYKYGYIKGRYLVLIPLAGYLGLLFLGNKLDLRINPVIFIIALLMLCIIGIFLSMAASIRILQDKEA